MTSHVGELLIAWRKRKKLTSGNLSRQARISRTTLTRWEAGQTQPRIAELEAVLTALEVSPAQRQEALAHIEAPRAVQRLREVAGESPPVRGDLLRAMRLRQGWTQQNTAKRAGIAQGTLARWERSEDWPSTERLHALCYALHAQEAELIALTQGLVTAALPVEAMLDNETVRTTIAHYMFSSSLADVEFLSFEAQLWPLAQKEEAAKRQLIYTYGSHARFLVEHQRFAEASVYVKRVHQLARSGYREAVGLASVVIAEARIAGAGGRVPHPERAMQILRTWVDSPLLTERKEYRAWMRSEMAKCLLKMGEVDSALLLSQQAIRFAEDVDDSEPWWRRGDYARVLLATGRGGQALEECSAYLSLEHPLVEGLPFLLTGAQALAVIDRSAEAADWLQQMDNIIAAYPVAAHYSASTQALRQRL